MKVFTSYSHKDKLYRAQLDTHLSSLKREGVIEVWHDRKITAGREWADQIDENLEQASIILLLISSDFLASDYCYDKEMVLALEKHQNGEARIIPIIIRAVDWHTAPFAKLQALPQDGKPIASWKNKDEAWTDVAKAIRQVVQELSSKANPSANQRPDGHRSPVWNIPLERNPFFTGREDILGEIHEALLSTKRAAFSGLGGIGKTQTAVEYAYQFKDEYSQILWIKAESKESLTSDFAQLASVLDLREKQAQDQQEIVKAVQRWLQQHDLWLLILDNADDLSLIQPFIQGLQTGHILLTTRAQATGTISRVEVRELPEQEGAVFLLRRAKLADKGTSYETISQELRTQALAIVKELAGLPLALDQAGAYIEETQCGLVGYLNLYNTHGVDLLKERGLFAPGHPDPVATTWVLSYQNIEQANPAAAELLRFCAFLAPDGIPEELITQNASELGDLLGPVAENPLLLNKAIGEILKYSLLNRKIQSKTLDIHRLVQAVIQNSLDEETKPQVREQVVRAMNHVFPEVEFHNWPHCDRLLPQAQHCTSFLIPNSIHIPEASSLFNKTGEYLHERARYVEAEPLFQRALAIREEALGPTHPDVAGSLNNLASLYKNQGKYPEAEPLFQRALAICEEALGSEHPTTKIVRGNYADLLKMMEGKKD
ncbi:MAG: FxSxx-COOH system tetratricopeptide repeat protein [Nitrospirota bacterium]